LITFAAINRIMGLKPPLNEIQKLAKDKHIENKKYFDKLKKKDAQKS